MESWAVLFAAAAAAGTDCHKGSSSFVTGVAVAVHTDLETPAVGEAVVAAAGVAVAVDMGFLAGFVAAVAAMVAAGHKDSVVELVDLVAD